MLYLDMFSIGESIMAYGLLFHSVDKKNTLSLSRCSTDRFRAILDRLKSLPEKTTAITFDDGLVSFYDNAFPLLQERNLKSTAFIIAGTIGKSGNWDVMGQTKHMDAAMIREIADGGHEIGSHSLTHANLIWLDDRELKKELRDSKMILEDIIGKSVKSLSFPFGSWNRRVWETARSVGYEYAAAYRGHKRALSTPGIMPVFGVYGFDAVDDVIDRVTGRPSSLLSLSSLLNTRTLATLMSHFAKGTPVCKFRREYYLNFPC